MTDLLVNRVDLPYRPSGRGLLAIAEPLPEGWENGIAFLGIGCNEPVIRAACTVSDGSEVRPNDAAIFEPIFIQQTAACSTLSKIGSVDMATSRLEGTTEWALGRSLATGVGSANPALTDAELVHAGVDDDVVSVVSCLEQGIADVGYGAEAYLHAPLRAAAWLRSADMVDDLGLSPAGFRWIFSAGYPVGDPSGDDQTVTIWATGTVFASVGEAYDLIDGQTGRVPSGWRYNTDAAYRQRLGLAAFDPCLNLSASFIVTACSGGS